MKKLLYFCFAIVCVASIASCGQSKAEKERLERERQDSIEEVERRELEEERKAAALEQQRLDSIRQAVIEAMPTVSWFVEKTDWGQYNLKYKDQIAKLLLNKGFEKVNSNKYVLNPGGEPSCTVTIKQENWDGEYDENGEYLGGAGGSLKYTVTFSDEEYAKAFGTREVEFASISRKGNTITLQEWTD